MTVAAPTLGRAYSLLHVKALDADTRRLSGIATTPEPDRHGDVLEPLGVSFRNPLPLLLFHDTHKPVGFATFHAPTATGIAFDAHIVSISEPGPLKDRVDEAWQSVKAGLVSGVSIGFRPIDMDVRKTGGVHFLKTEVVELSLVTVPANAQATILTVKSLDQAALGQDHSRRVPPGVAGLPSRTAPMTTAEQIAQWSNLRAPKAARVATLMAASADSQETLDDAQAQEFDTLEKEIKSIDTQLTRLRTVEQLNMGALTPITGKAADASAERGGLPRITLKPTVPAGTAFVRAACAILTCKGNVHEAAEYARQRWDSSTPEVAVYLKAAIAPGTTTDPTWAGPLVNQTIAQDFLELLRPATILGKISGLRNVPFNTKVPAQSAGGTYGWVGEAKPKPVTKLAFAAETLGITKVAGIIVLTEELVRLSNPASEGLARADMIAGIARFLDAQFLDPAVAAVPGVNPASITNGAPTAAATTDPLADLLALMQHFATNNIPLSGVHIIMSEVNALALAFARNSDGSSMFPNVSVSGGSAQGLTIVTSQAAGANVIAVQPSYILYADDGGVTIDASREASLQMDSAPTTPADATTVLVSLWQHNLVGLRAERFANWKRANANAVKYLTAAAYPAPTTGFQAPQSAAKTGRA
jgi:HK97 family phage major capsid protein/HK97 family phage prohead protease